MCLWQAHVAPHVAERAAAGGAVAAVQSLAAEPLPIWASHAVLVQACNQVRIFTNSTQFRKESGMYLGFACTYPGPHQVQSLLDDVVHEVCCSIHLGVSSGLQP